MRILVRASIPVEAGNKGLKDGSLPRTIGEFAEKAKPESLYFTLRGGARTMYAVVEIKENWQLPPLLEPFFANLNASVDYSPCMNADDLQKAMKAMGGK